MTRNACWLLYSSRLTFDKLAKPFALLVVFNSFILCNVNMTRAINSRLSSRCRHFCCLCFSFRSSIYLFLKAFSLLFIYSFFSHIRPIQCDHWEYKLIHSFLRGYDSSIRPSLHRNMTLNVTFGLALAQLIDVVSNKFA